KNDFRSLLREVEPAWVARLIGVRSQSVDEFAVWLLTNVPKFEQSAFRQMGLHEPVLSLLDSPSEESRQWAAAYARTHARDPRLGRKAADFALEALSRFEVGELGAEFLRRALLHPLSSSRVGAWIDQERISPQDLGAEFLKTLAYQPAWEGSAWVEELRRSD